MTSSLSLANSMILFYLIHNAVLDAIPMPFHSNVIRNFFFECNNFWVESKTKFPTNELLQLAENFSDDFPSKIVSILLILKG